MEYYFTIDEKPVYLTRASSSTTSTTSKDSASNEPSPHHEAASFLSNFCFIVEKKSESTDAIKDYLRSCISVNEIVKECERKGIKFSLGAKDENQRLSRCVMIRSELTTDLTNVIEKNKDLKIYTLAKDDLFIRREAKGEVDDVVRLEVKECGSGKVPPMFENEDYSPITKTLERAKTIMEKVSDITEVRELLDIVEQEIPSDISVEEMRSRMKHSFVVFEGLDATGKTTLTTTLEKKLKAVRIYSLPTCLRPLRAFFESMPEIIRRAYYAIGNHITAVTIAKEAQSRPVIGDRFWCSSAVYTIAHETTEDDILPEGHEGYSWPRDLIRPEAVILLTVPEDTRKQRIIKRGEMAEDEEFLNSNTSFRNRLFTAYTRLHDPPCIRMDASGSKKEVVEKVSSVLLERGFK